MRFLTVTAVLASLTTALPTPAEDLTSNAISTASNIPSTEHDLLDQALDSPRCINPTIRKSWYSLSKAERKNWTAALRCLQTKPSKNTPLDKIPGARTRYDDFVGIHILRAYELVTRTGGVHMVGSFHAWHRYYIAAFETALKEECGYEGGQPYWDWTTDADSGLPIDQWEIWNADYGVGGNGPYVKEQPVSESCPYMPGNTGGGCVLNGPFVNYTINLGPGMVVEYNPHCMHRGLNPDTVPWLKSERLVSSQNASTFVEYDLIIQGEQYMDMNELFKTLHGSGHYTAGGDSNDFISSVVEPIFWLHHTYMDYLYWKWQMKDPVKRLSDIGGVSVPFDATSPQVTLNDTLDILWEGPIIQINDVMDIRRGVLCYDYQ